MRNTSLIVILVLIAGHCFSQQLYLVKDKKRVLISRNMFIGIESKTDTISIKDRNYYIHSFQRDSIILRKNLTFRDTIAVYDEIYNNSIPFIYETVDYFKKNGKLYCRIREVLSYDELSIAYQDISKITYPYNNNGRSDGCIGCWIIPGVNVWYYFRSTKHLKMSYDIGDWVIVYE